MQLKHASLFSGIGGPDLAADWMGWENAFHCEWNPFGQRILKYYWPEAETFTDITKSDFRKYANTIDVLTGGFPCQPYSLAGKRQGKADERHLWPEMLRAIREIRPRWIVGENVFGLVNWNGGMVFDEVQSDLEAAGYEVQPYVLPACAKNAPHRRDRVWFVAHANGLRYRGQGEQPGTNNSEERKIYQNIQQHRYGVRSEAEGCSRNDTNTASQSGRGQLQQQQGQGKFRRCDSENIIADTNSGRQPCKEYRQAEPGRVAKKSLSTDWRNFPTQSPICERNDGFSARLDNITFPKWRNESIKAGGNAIVPQVIYEIFKAIEQYELNPTNI
ncbi:MAG: DNA cytosine methyltransferase [Bacteroidia bacterium]